MMIKIAAYLIIAINECFCFAQLLILENGRKVGSLPVDFEPSSLSINPVSGDVAVGGSMDSKVCYVVMTNEKGH